MLRPSTRHLLLAVAVAAGFLALARSSGWMAASLAFVLAPFSCRVGIALRRLRCRGRAPSPRDWAGLVAGSAFQAGLGAWGAAATFGGTAWRVHEASGGRGGPWLNLGAGAVAALVVLVVLADPFLWWAGGDRATGPGPDARAPQP